MKSAKLFTVGYEGRNIDEFMLHLRKHNINRLIDVRERPLSRKKGFSKRILKDRLANENILYTHIKTLGSPSALRRKLKDDSNFLYFFKAYRKYLSENPDAIQEAHAHVLNGINCIMCFERLAEYCHRSALAEEIRAYDGNGMKIIHI